MLESEDTQLKRVLAEVQLAIHALQEVFGITG
jgi:hypothetical protein